GGGRARRGGRFAGVPPPGLPGLRASPPAPAARPVSAHAATHPVSEHVTQHPGRDRRLDDPRHVELMALADQLRANDAYEVLGVAREASEGQGKAAYERLAARAHPDRFRDGSQALRALAEEVFG